MLKGAILRKTINANDWYKVFYEYIPEKSDIIIEKTIELNENEFDDLYNSFLEDRKYITENKDKMWKDEKGWHMLAITNKARDTVICIDSENFDYNRCCSILKKHDFEWIYRRRCNCKGCDKKLDCIHKDAFRRMPKEIGGLGLCPKLKDNTDPCMEKRV